MKACERSRACRGKTPYYEVVTAVKSVGPGSAGDAAGRCEKASVEQILVWVQGGNLSQLRSMSGVPKCRSRRKQSNSDAVPRFKQRRGCRPSMTKVSASEWVMPLVRGHLEQMMSRGACQLEPRQGLPTSAARIVRQGAMKMCDRRSCPAGRAKRRPCAAAWRRSRGSAPNA